MSLAILTAPNEGRVQGQGDRRGCGRWVGRGGVDQVRADLERADAQGLGIAPGIDRQKVFENAGSDLVGQAGGKLRPDLVELAIASSVNQTVRLPRLSRKQRFR
jgi:hypothetical protein